MSEQKVILLCSSRFAFPSMRDLLFHKQLAAVVIPSYCGDMLEQSRLFLSGSSIPLIEVEKQNCNEILAAAINENAVTLGLIMSFPYKIKTAVFNLPEKGFFNVHPGPLPAYRGADPVFQQIRNREKNAGVTIHKLEEGFDTGAIVIQEMIRLDSTDTYGLLTTKLSALAAKLCGVLIKLASFDLNIPGRKQDESKAIYYKKQMANEISINWNTMDADEVMALIQACNPWNKGAVTKLNGNIVRLLEASVHENEAGIQNQPGTILTIDQDGIVISTINNKLLRVQIIYIEEGFLMAGRLRQLGIQAGHFFEMI